MKKCIKCGLQIADDAKYCEFCGGSQEEAKEDKKLYLQFAEYSRIVGVVSLCLCGTGIILGLSLGIVAMRLAKYGMKTSKKDIAHQGHVLGLISVIISSVITVAFIVFILIFVKSEAVQNLISIYFGEGGLING